MLTVMQTDGEPLLALEGVQVHFPVRGGVFMRARGVCRAVDGVSLTVQRGETLGLVGESGCGKTTLGRAVVRLHPVTAGRIRFAGADITRAGRRELMTIRRDLQMIFQDPAESLNPRHTVGGILEEPYLVHKLGTAAEREGKVRDLLERVGLPSEAMPKFPFEFSGGQRQRIGIARAIALHPKLIVCDEPVSALDVSVQSQVLNLLLDLQRELGLAYLFIAHDLSVVRHVSDRIAVMYLGRLMEVGPADEVYGHPTHAYTRALIEAIPILDPRRRRQLEPLEGDVPSPIDPPPGCAFGFRMGHPRYGESIGKEIALEEVGKGHWVARCPCCVDG